MSRFKSSFSGFNKEVEKSPLEISGRLGLPIGGERKVDVPGRNAFVYVRLRDNQNEVIQAFNNQVSPAYDLPVKVVREGNRYIVKGVDTQRYQSNWSSTSSFLPRHHTSHEFDVENGGGGDIVWVNSRQFMPMLSIPSGSSGAPNVVISPYTLRDMNGLWKYVGNTGTINLTQYNPTGSFGVMVLVYIDASSGNPGIIVNSGSYFPATYTGTASLVPYFPSLPTNPNFLPDAAIRLVSGTLVIGWDNIYDARQFYNIVPTGTSGGLSSIAVQDEARPLGSAVTFNFVGGRVLASLSGTVARIDLSPEPMDNIGVMVWNVVTPVATGTNLVFSGPFTISNTGSSVFISSDAIQQITVGQMGTSAGSALGIYFTGTGIQNVGFGIVDGLLSAVVHVVDTQGAGPGQDQIGVYIQDEGVPKGTGTVLNFVGAGVDVSISGSVARVFVTGTNAGIPSGTIQIFNTGSFLGSVDKLDYQYPLAVGITGSRGYPYLRGSLLAYEDVTYQIVSGSAVTHFNLSGTMSPGTDRLYYNGVRQRRGTHYSVDSDGRGFTTFFTGTVTRDGPDTFIIEYGNLGTQGGAQLNIYDDNVFKGTAQSISFDSGLDASVDAGGVAHISGSSASGGGDMVKLFDHRLAAATGSFVFSGIPNTYTHLLIKASLRGTGTVDGLQGELIVEINGDTNFNTYSRIKVSELPSGTSTMVYEVGASANSNLFGYIPVGSNSRLFSDEEWRFNDYTNNAKYKTINRKGAFFVSTVFGLNQLFDVFSWWENTGTISIIRILAGQAGEPFAAESRMTLYGLK